MANVADVLPGDVASAVAGAGERGALARGLGRSYGDAAQNSGGLVVRLPEGMASASLDETSGTLTVSAGASLDDILRYIVPRGYFVPVTPGTRMVTVGGAIASDIHGKNHHVDGSIGDHVGSITMVLASGETTTVSRTERPDLFWATIGGMGLTGIILEATLRLLPVETSRMSVDTQRIPDFDSLIAEMAAGDDRYRYSVAWLDPVAAGASFGRGVLTRAHHATLAQLPVRDQDSALRYDPRQRLVVPPVVPGPGVINRLSVKAFNEAWFRKAPLQRNAEIQSIAAFFHPLDMVAHWNRVYGRAGLVQYQVVVPFGEEPTLQRILERVVDGGAISFLTVLKRFGSGNEAHLSFPRPGWTLALDVPAATPELSHVIREIDSLVLSVGGRHYAAKDAQCTPDAFRQGYPRLAEWQAIQRSVDPGGLWQSDLARRLGLLSSQPVRTNT